MSAFLIEWVDFLAMAIGYSIIILGGVFMFVYVIDLLLGRVLKYSGNTKEFLSWYWDKNKKSRRKAK